MSSGCTECKHYSESLGGYLVAASLQAPLELPWWNLKLAPSREGREKPKKEAGHSRLVGGSFIQQGNSCMRLVLGHCKMTRSLHLSAIILSLYKDLTSHIPSSHVYHPDGLNTTILSQVCVLGTSSGAGKGNRIPIRRTGQWGTTSCQGPAHTWTSGHVLSMISLSCSK